MTAIEITNGRPESGGYKVDVSRDGHNGRVSSEWFSRPDDEKFLSLSDLYFRGFYCWNSEVGAKTLGIASFYLRTVCQNRNLWGVEDFQEISIRHSKYAANRFAHEAAPALASFADSSPRPFIEGIRAAREKIVASSDDDRTDFLRKRGFSKAETAKIVETVLAEEGRPPESVFDFVQGITAVARSKPQQDARLAMETRAKRLLEKAA